jgi:hypothetical protein
MPTTEGALRAYAGVEQAPASPTPTPAATTQGKPVAPHLAYSPLRKPLAAMSGEIKGPSRASSRPFKPALISIPDAIYYLGGLSRSKFYNDVLPLVDTVKIGKRNFVTTDSLDRLIAANQRSAQSQAGRPESGATPAA